jgi:phospholipid N-methyltransferase
MNPGLFLKHVLKEPAIAGAFLPSSPLLARAMTRQAGHASLIVELGAGTGAVTRWLHETHPSVPIIAVEAQPEMAAHLRATFPAIDVRRQWAHDVLDELRDDAPYRTVVVSSLPFRSLKPSVRDVTVRSVCRFLHADRSRHLVQYTYQPRVPFALPRHEAHGLEWTRVSTVWRNAPPAGVWVLKARASRLMPDGLVRT